MSETSPLRPGSPSRNTVARAAQAGFSLVWLVPILALVVTLGLAWNAFSGRGELITVEFSDATGHYPRRHRPAFPRGDRGQGRRRGLHRGSAQCSGQHPGSAGRGPYIDDKAEFWIVRPVVSAQGISRLDTVLSGVFIEGFWDATTEQKQTHFVGQDQPTLARMAGEGTWFVLSSPGAKGSGRGRADHLPRSGSRADAEPAPVRKRRNRAGRCLHRGAARSAP